MLECSAEMELFGSHLPLDLGTGQFSYSVKIDQVTEIGFTLKMALLALRTFIGNRPEHPFPESM